MFFIAMLKCGKSENSYSAIFKHLTSIQWKVVSHGELLCLELLKCLILEKDYFTQLNEK